MRGHVNTLTVLQGVIGLLHLLGAIALALPLLGLGTALGRHASLAAGLTAGSFGVALLALAGSIGLTGMLLAWGLARRQEWARLASILVALPGLVVVPTGTILSMYTLWVLTSDEATRLFVDRPSTPRSTGPSRRTIVLTWAGSAALLALVVGGLRWSVAVSPLRTGGAVPQALAVVEPVEAAEEIAEAKPPKTRRQEPATWWRYQKSDNQVVIVESLDDVPEAYREQAIPVPR